MSGQAMATPTTQRSSTLNPSAREWFPPGYAISNNNQAQPGLGHGRAEEVNTAAVSFPMSELPMEILSSVMAFLATPQDLCSCILASQQLQGAVRSSRLSFELKGSTRQRLSFPSQTGQLDELVHSLTHYMPAMSACNLSMLPLEHQHVRQLAQGLVNLQHLDLSGCKKLQPSMTQQLLQHLASKQVLSINLQRCFQLTDACLTGVLEYACGSHSSSRTLQCIALSHLNLAGWPAADSPADVHHSHNGDNNNNSLSTVNSADSSPGSSDANPSVQGSYSSDGPGSDFDDDDANNSSGVCPSSMNSKSNSNSINRTPAMDWCRLAADALCKLPKQLGMPVAGLLSASALRVVVLNNCSLLPATGLISLAAVCPQLEYLFLGGSTLKSPLQLPAADGMSEGAAGAYVPRSVAAAAAAAAIGGGRVEAGAGSADVLVLPGALQQLSDLLQLPATLPWDVLSTCCDASSCSSTSCGQAACSCTCNCCSSMRARLQHSKHVCSNGVSDGVDVDDLEAQHERARKRLHRIEPSAAAVSSSRGQALSLAYVAALLPGLKALEVSFMAPGIAGWLRVCLDRLHQLRLQQQQQPPRSVLGSIAMEAWGCAGSSTGLGNSSSSSSVTRPQVWQLSCVASVADAMQVLAQARSASKACRGSSNQGGSGALLSEGCCLDPSCLAMALRCAVNCSNRGRSTPLHMAADAGCACHIRALLAAGAAVAARDASGASPLFVACESGQAAAVGVLLEAGADALVGNTAGETPLYIAALRGHLRVVELLLQHLSAAEVDWTQRQLYGDAWTPLMAAAVANRVNVALCLLRAAAMRCCGGKDASAVKGLAARCDLQAARCGVRSGGAMSSSTPQRSWQLAVSGVRGAGVSCCPGVARLLAAENRYGQTVLHIAARKGCRELLQLLLLYGAGQVAGRVVDAAGDTPLDIARRHGHETAVRELLQQC